MSDNIKTIVSGVINLGGARFQVSMQIPGTTLQADLPEGQTLDFKKFVTELLPDNFLQLPPSGFPDLKFDRASIEIAGEQITVRAGSYTSWDNPFGILRGVTVSSFALTFTSSGREATTISFSTDARYEGLPTLKGLINFEKGSLEVVACLIQQDLSIEQFLSNSVPRGLEVWGDLLRITFKPQSPSQPMRLYYASADYPDATSPGRYLQGFNIDQTIVDILGYDALISLNVKDGVITVSGQLQQAVDLFDLGFLIIKDRDFAGSPKVSVSTSPSAFTLQASYTFLNKQFGSSDLTIEKTLDGSGYQFHATLTYDGSIGPFDKPTFAFTWNKQNGFRVDNWNPPEELLADIGLLQQLNQLSKENPNGCGDLFGAALDSLVKTKFRVKLGFSGSSIGVNIVLNGSYSIYVAERLIVCVDFPNPVNVQIDKPYGLERIPEILVDAIVRFAKNLVNALISNPEKSAKFFGAIGAYVGAKAVAGYLVALACNGWEAIPPPSQPSPPVRPPQPHPTPTLPPPPALPIGLPSQKTPGPQQPQPPSLYSLTYAGGKVTAEWSPVKYANGYLFYLVRADDATPIGGLQQTRAASASVDFPDTQPAKTYYGQAASLSHDFAGFWGPSLPIQKLAVPSVATLTFSDGQITATWNSVDGNDGYRIRLVDGNGQQMGQPVDADKDIQTVALIVPPDALAGKYYAQALAKATEPNAIPSNWGDSSTVSLQKLAAPTVATLVFAGGQIASSWNKIDGNDGYQWRLLDSSGEPIGQPTNVAKDIQTAEVTFPPNALAGTYFAQIMTRAAVDTTIPSDWGKSSTVSLQKLAAPDVATPTFADGKVTATWNKIDGSDGYQLRLRLVPASGEAVELTQDVPKDFQTAGTVLPPDAPDGRCTVQVMTKAPGDTAIPSDWGTPQTIDVVTLTPESLARQLKADGKTAAQASPLIKTRFPALDLFTLATALFRVFQPPNLTQTELSVALVIGLPVPPLDATSLARTLVAVYPFAKPVTANALTDTAQALKAIGFDMNATGVALGAAYDHPNPTVLATVLKQVFIGSDLTPESLAQRLKADRKTPAQAAWSIKTRFPALDLSTLATALVSVFQPPNLTQTELSAALVAAFPVPPLDATTLARTLVTIYPFTKPVTASALMETARAVKAAGFTIDRAAVALASAYDSPNQVTLATVLRQIFLGPALLKFDGASTSVTLSKRNIDQIGFRDSGHPNHLVDLASPGFTIDVSIYPEALDDRPIVTLIYDRDGSYWKAGDLTVELSLSDGHIRVSALTPEWSAGTPYDARLVTVTTAATVPLKQWSNITAVWQSGGLVAIYLNGQAQTIEVQSNHDRLNNINAQFNGLMAYVNTFEPRVHRFLFGNYKNSFFQGYMKNVKIWTGARSANDINRDPYRRLTGSEIALAQTSLLAGFWPLDEGSGNIARDLTQVQNNGNILNPAWSSPDT